MNPIVVKFGGSSLATAGQFEKVAAIVRENPGRRYVVASAPGKRFSGDTKASGPATVSSSRIRPI